MALDGIVIRALANELQTLIGGRINKIHQPTEHDVVMQIRGQGNNARLLVSANPTYPRLHLTAANFINPLEAPMFCMLLRKHCEGGIIEAIKQIGMERIIHIDIRQRDELGDIRTKTVVAEIMGRHSNIILLDPATQTVLDGIHHVTPAVSSYRIVMPGSVYTPPPDQHKINPESVAPQQFAEAVQEAEDTGASTPSQAIVSCFSGISPLLAKEIVYRSGIVDDRSPRDPSAAVRLWEPFSAIIRQVTRQKPEPCTVEAPDGKMSFSVVSLTHLNGNIQIFPSVSECLEAFYGEKAERDTVKQKTADLARLLQNEKQKNEKKIEKLQDTIKEALEADRWRVMGELLTAHLHQIERGSKEIEVVNYYDEEQRTILIPLDVQLTPSENAQRYFKKYGKSKNSLLAAREQIAAAKEEIRYMENLLQQLEHASLSDIGEIREELAEQGYVRQRHRKQIKQKKANQKPNLNCYTSSEGIPIYVGKNNIQNEYLTNRLAHSGDTWLHTKDIPGSHVVIRGEQFGQATLNDAAQLAAYFSQARNSSQVPVDMTLIKHVRKPNGAKPGFVIYDHQKTLFVTPDEAYIKQMAVQTRS